MNSIVRFFKNKNTVTALGVLLIIAVLCLGYYYTVQKKVKPVSIPVANQTIQPRTPITSDMIKYIEVPESYLSDNVVRSETEILSKYTQYNTLIPSGSMFYKETLATPESMPNYLASLLKEGEFAVYLDLNSESKTGGFLSSIMPGDKIDIYMKVETQEGSVMLGKFMENVEILAALDSEGNNVFEVNDGSRTTEYLYFGVKEDLFLLLLRSQYLEVSFFPVQHGAWVDDKDADLKLSTQELIDYLNARVTHLSSDPVTSTIISEK